MVLFKSCPRCTGDRVIEDDPFGVYITCLACGHVSYPDDHATRPGEKVRPLVKLARVAVLAGR